MKKQLLLQNDHLRVNDGRSRTTLWRPPWRGFSSTFVASAPCPLRGQVSNRQPSAITPTSAIRVSSDLGMDLDIGGVDG